MSALATAEVDAGCVLLRYRKLREAPAVTTEHDDMDEAAEYAAGELSGYALVQAVRWSDAGVRDATAELQAAVEEIAGRCERCDGSGLRHDPTPPGMAGGAYGLCGDCAGTGRQRAG